MNSFKKGELVIFNNFHNKGASEGYQKWSYSHELALVLEAIHGETLLSVTKEVPSLYRLYIISKQEYTYSHPSNLLKLESTPM